MQVLERRSTQWLIGVTFAAISAGAIAGAAQAPAATPAAPAVAPQTVVPVPRPPSPAQLASEADHQRIMNELQLDGAAARAGKFESGNVQRRRTPARTRLFPIRSS